ncbi:DUF418 domain-containing protein [Dactylosporangium sp. NPDC005555]|uniref:DUF418 domain-containing protein n=1 Tax=Dactylosporangium sp. NPDC005555 TaxID=3154889 RepID=UPI0033B14A9E
MSTTVTAGPLPPAQRVLAPDLGRGLLLLAIALANAALHRYGPVYGIRLHPLGGTPLDHAVEAVLVTFVDGRAYPLFAALFAYGTVQLSRRCTGGAKQLVRRRARWLLVLGSVHAVALFSGDVLGTYALLSLVLLALAGARDRTLLWLGGLWLLPTAVITALVYGIRPAEPGRRQYLWSMAIADPLEALAWRPLEWLMTLPAMAGVGSAALAGVWAARRRILESPADHRPLLRRVAAIGIGLATAGGIPTAAAVIGRWRPGDGTLLVVSGLHGVTGVAGGLGYLALIGLLAARAQTPAGPVAAGARTPPAGLGVWRARVIRALVATGRRSLSMYLAQSVVFAGLFTAWAGGLGDDLGAAAVAGTAVLTWAATVAAAVLLERRGMRGPAEVLLRRLTYR